MRNYSGNIALTTVLVFSGMLVLTGITIIIQAIDFGASTTSYTNQIYAQNTSFSCLEESLFKLSSNTAYTGSFQISSTNGGTCDATVTGTAPNKSVSIESSYRSSNYNTTKSIDTSQTPFTVN